mmetsp:Transcript_562/g.1125  ORF Transcript_562/g.1125 Transcript_562/m.1125 type:complete len:419 (-) Transcript_562:61-1317(-)
MATTLLPTVLMLLELFCMREAHLTQNWPLQGPEACEHHFLSFMQRYGRTYEQDSEEFSQRLYIFSRNMAEVDAHNDRPERQWTAAINEFADRTETELAQLRGWRGGALPSSLRAQQQRPSRAGSTFLKQSAKATVLPRDFSNWTRLKSLQSIRDQGGCGSCWAVAGITVLDAHWEIYSAANKTRAFSVQELVKCVRNPHHCGGTGGCAGATVELAYDYAINQGLATQEELPYDPNSLHNGQCKNQPQGDAIFLSDAAEKGMSDSIDIAKPGVHVAQVSPATAVGMRAWERLPENTYEPLMRAVYERGPVAISVAASPWSWYSKGVFDKCPKDAVIDHAVTLIGFGEDLGHKYWLVQNSWGQGWGEDGRIRIVRHDSDDQHCGVDRQPEVGTGCEGGPAQVKVCGMCGILYDTVVPHFK